MTASRIVSALCCVLLLSVTAVVNAGPRFCDDGTAKLVSRAYVLSFPLLGQDSVLERLINDNPSAFGGNGAATRCMRELGSALLQHVIKQHQQQNPYAAQEQFGGSMPEGLEHLPAQVDAGMQSAGSEFFTMSQELLWLAQVLPAALGGDARPYNAQGTQWRQMMLSVRPQLQALCSMDASACQIFLSSMNASLPIAEQQVYQLATGRY